ncbi:cytochrome b562 [Acinetobacter sp. ANC 4633]|uniref:cytochrome b562 n=1 Tax=Acinetobacter sp. ANC 4633 TaxID=2529845 RepID=UPI001D195A69|nr:cytochrome b562 [Acinetobacter sp. ANC 4633]
MKKFVVAGVLAVSSMLASQWGMAATLEDDMRTLAIGYKTFAGSDNAQQATAALTKMRAAALDSKKLAPAKVQKDPKQLKAYHAGVDQLVGEIDKTNALVKAGQLAQAKQEGKKLLDIRDTNHKKFR